MGRPGVIGVESPDQELRSTRRERGRFTATINVLDKVSFHLKEFAWSRSAKFIFYRMTQIVSRRLRLPMSDIADVFISRHKETFLKPYLIPSPGRCFVDVGANVGSWTTFVAEKGFKVHAFEPNPETCRHLMKNTERYPHVHIHPCALGESQHVAELLLHQMSGHDSLVKMDDDFTGSAVRVPVRALDNFDLSEVGVIKIDAEGSEYPILLGAKETINSDRPRIIVEAHSPYQEERERITGFLWDMGYHCEVLLKRRTGQPYVIAEPAVP